jgi:hypothetical protein
MAGRNDRAGRQGNSERDGVVREGAHGEARGPDLVGGRGHHQAAATRRRARAGRGVMVRRRVPQSPQACRPLGTLRRTSAAPLALLHDCMCYPSCHVGTTTVLDGCAVCLQGYPVSKVLLEKEASRFAEHGIGLVTVCPGLTVGAAPAPTARTSVPNCLSLLSGEALARSGSTQGARHGLEDWRRG